MSTLHEPQRVQIGSIIVTILQMGFLRWDILEELIVPPESQDEEYAAIPTGAHIYPTQGALIESGDAKILVDGCVHRHSV